MIIYNQRVLAMTLRLPSAAENAGANLDLLAMIDGRSGRDDIARDKPRRRRSSNSCRVPDENCEHDSARAPSLWTCPAVYSASYRAGIDRET